MKYIFKNCTIIHYCNDHFSQISPSKKTTTVQNRYQYTVDINDYIYQFYGSLQMTSIDDAQYILTHAVETDEKTPVNILGPLEGELISPTRFEGKILFADDFEDGSDYNPDTERYVDVSIVFRQI